MVEYNQYNAYSYSADEMKTACDDKILVDLHRLDSLKKFSEINKFIDENIGEVTDSKTFEYPNDIQVLVIRDEESVMVVARQGEKHLMGKRWKRPEGW